MTSHGFLKKPKQPRKPKRPISLRRVAGASMQPSLKHGQIVVFRHWRMSPRSGDVIMIKHDGLDKIKRLHAIKEGHIYVVGDNPAQSTDSRQFGWLPSKVIIGVLVSPKVAAPKHQQPNSQTNHNNQHQHADIEKL